MTDDATRQAVLAANQGFMEALNAMFKGDAAPMLDVWSHADDVTYMGPAREYLVGWAAIAESWKKQAEKRFGGWIESRQARAVISGELAIVTDIGHGDNPHSPGGDMPVDIRATSAFRLEGGVWKMIHHHTDLLLPLVDS
ncbi:MAG: nuclear transport factor 2 family protein [Planctomycetota bacterium]